MKLSVSALLLVIYGSANSQETGAHRLRSNRVNAIKEEAVVISSKEAAAVAEEEQQQANASTTKGERHLLSEEEMWEKINALQILRETTDEKAFDIVFNGATTIACASILFGNPLAPILCASTALFGQMLSAFTNILGIFGDSKVDDVWISIELGKNGEAGGNSLEVKYHGIDGEVDQNTLARMGSGIFASWREDLTTRQLHAIEIYVDETDGMCVRNFGFTVGPEVSGTGQKELLVIPAEAISYLTGASIFGNDGCVNFGDDEHSIGNFKFHWPSALTCYKNYIRYPAQEYAECLRHALYGYDIKSGDTYTHHAHSDSPSLPSDLSSPFKPLWSYGVPICMDLANYNTDNGNAVTLVECSGNDAQLWDFDLQGRIRSKIDPTKCIESGAEGVMYQKLYIWDCHNEDWQRWLFRENGRIQNAYNSMYMGLSYCRKEIGTQLELRHYEDGDCSNAQEWEY